MPFRAWLVRGRALPWAEGAAFVAAAWAVDSRGASYDSAAMAGGVLAAVACWALTAGVLLFAELAVSVDEFRRLVRHAVTASAPAMWLPGALLLIAFPSPGVSAAGFLLLAVAVRALFSGRLPRSVLYPGKRKRRVRGERFGGRRPVIAGAFAWQGAFFAVCTGSPIGAALLSAGGAAAWTISAVAREAYAPPPLSPLRRSLFAIPLTLLAAASISPAVTGRTILQRAAWPIEPSRETPKLNATRVVPPPAEDTGGYKDGVPGLILRPGAVTAKRVWLPQRIGQGNGVPALRDSLTIPFTGEYHLFRRSSGALPGNSPVRQGTPLEEVYFSTNGSPMELQAWQWFQPAVNLGGCGWVEDTFTSDERMPATASLQLVTADGFEDLGMQVFGLSSRREEETLGFAIPPDRARLPVSALRVVFRRNPWEPKHSSQSTKVAVLRFTLKPRGF